MTRRTDPRGHPALRFLSLASTVLAAFLAGCITETVEEGPRSSRATVTVNGIDFIGETASTARVEAEGFALRVGGRRVQVSGDTLRIDGTPYGTVGPGDTVDLTSPDAVVVNGAEREPGSPED